MSIHLLTTKSILFLDMSILLRTFASIKELRTVGHRQAKGHQDIMTYQIKIDWSKDFLLEEILRKEMNRLWGESLFMAKCSKDGLTRGDFEIFWADRIDWVADLVLQVREQSWRYEKR